MKFLVFSDVCVFLDVIYTTNVLFFQNFIMHVLTLTVQQPFRILGYSLDHQCLTCSIHPDTPTRVPQTTENKIVVNKVWEDNHTIKEGLE